MKNKLKFITVLSLLFLIVFSLSVLAITESDVETAVKSSSKENVSGKGYFYESKHSCVWCIGFNEIQSFRS